ncbi:small nucleolar ribonucleoprotein complex component (Utp5), putative [Metarhizium acridum CQMa 102]|uniref:Small nucleolar ribonucleoprotein complex component (Utp5), putative n=1 Tax=Metarhizium acridum (strain CQMa 102) TaxID=655827 RepID=E9DVY7_METAQ|nr:small nucleolar ribonucleoprotein complex component (Utp5), putative [Metarhizium acridum CQMa 102]EFY92184.1 small nucleolar ribonucleoprotein complex component (Utp5), putative [Metarhizium acridum CQMa 102]
MPMSMKRKVPAKLAAPVVKPSAKIPTKTTIDESRTSVATADALQGSQMEAIEISSDPDSDEDISDLEDNAEEEHTNGGEAVPKAAAAVAKVNGTDPKANDHAEPSGSDEEEETSPSFGELLRGNDAIDVPALLQQSLSGSRTAQPARTVIVPPSHQSLTTVLTQALNTDDTDLLESCLHTTDITTVRNTIERIDSSLAGILLNKLAARLYRRPGRAGNLMTWVQWTLISHGGALASQPDVVHSLNGLQKVLAERAKGLNSLLALKGKLDMLDLQMDLRRKMQRSTGLLQQGEDADDGEEDAVWVEGEMNPVSKKDLANGARSRRRRDDGDDDDEQDQDNEDLPMTNGVGDSEDEEEDSDVAEDDDSEVAEESLDEDEVDHEDVDDSMGEEEESDVEAAPPSKMQKVGKSFSKRK